MSIGCLPSPRYCVGYLNHIKKKKKNVGSKQTFPELTFYSGRKNIKIKQIELYRIISYGIV